MNRRGFVATVVGAILARYLPDQKLLSPREYIKAAPTVSYGVGFRVTREMLHDDVYGDVSLAKQLILGARKHIDAQS